MRRLFACMLLAGCATSTPQPDFPDVVPDTPPQGPAAKRTPRTMANLTLERALELADRHPDVEVGRMRVASAEARARQAGVIPNPEAALRMESARFGGGSTGDAEFLAGIRQPFPIGGRLGAAERVEEADRVRLLHELEIARRDIRARVRGAFATALYASEVVRAQRDVRESAAASVVIAKARQAAGDALPEEVARAELEEIRVRLDVETAESMRDQAMAGLAASVGDAGVIFESVEGAMEAAMEIPEIETILAALPDSPWLKAAGAEIEAQRMRAELARAQRIPDVNVDLLYRRIGSTDDNAFDVGFSVALPIFDRNQHRIREIEAEIRGAEARRRSIASGAAFSLREAHTQLVRSGAIVRLLRDEITPRAETVLKGAEARYKAGDTSLAETLPLRRERTVVRLLYLAALRDMHAAWALLSRFLDIRRP